MTEQEKAIQFFLQSHDIQDLVNLPEMTDPYKFAATRILLAITSSTIITNHPLASVVILTNINLCLKYGNPVLIAASIYAWQGILLCSSIKNRDLDGGYQLDN